MLEFAIIFLSALLFIAAASTLSLVKANKKLRQKIDNEFGKKPVNQTYFVDDLADYHALNTSEDAVDDITWNDLDMDLVYKRINACGSSVGDEYLYHILHNCAESTDEILKRENLINYLKTNENQRRQFQFYIAKLGKTPKNGMYSFLKGAKRQQIKYDFLYKVFAVLPISCLLILPFNLPAGIICFISALCINICLYYFSKKNIAKDLAALEYFSSMLWCCKKILKANTQNEQFLQELEEGFQVFKPLCGKVPVSSANSFSDADMFVEYIKIMFLIDIRNYNKALKIISCNLNKVDLLFKSLAQLDVAICVLSFRESLPYFCLPQISDKNSLESEGIYHPLLDNAVANNVMLDKNCLITGSNASGKSTFIKAVAINAILAQSINTCMAHSFKARRALVISSMAVSDDITLGDSYFITEIKSLKRILDKANAVPCLCFVDEILKGTNTIERVSASCAVLEYLQNKNCLCVVATHDIELTQLLQGQYDNFHFAEQITDSGVQFDYNLKPGASETRNAIKLLKFMHFDNTIVENADALASNFTSTQKYK